MKKMKLKKSIKIIAAVFFIAATFFVSFGITLSAERNKISAVKDDSPVPVVNGAAETTPSEAPLQETQAEVSQSAAEQTGSFDKLPEPIIVNIPSDETWSLVLLNSYYKMNDTYEPHVDECLEGTQVYLDKKVVDAFSQMYNAALQSGVTLTPVSGYVSPDRQKRSFDKQVQAFVDDGYTEEKAEALASFSVLPVGCSEHNYGLAIDIGHRSADFADTPAYAWLKQHAAEYGFIERYTSGKESVTHFNASPWHWRYVGVDYAKEIVKKGVCLEEYVGKVN